MAIDPNTPVLIGVGQCVDHWNGADVNAAPDPATLRTRAAQAALADTGVADGAATVIDTVVAVRTMLDSVPGTPHPFGRCANAPGTLAADLGLNATNAIYSWVGGDQPQALVNEFAERIHNGDVKGVLLAGSEATAAMKRALRQGVTLDWSRSVEGNFDDRGLGPQLLSAYEMRNGLGAPTQTYPAFEHALRARLGHDRATHRALMSELWAAFSAVAATNPYAQYPVARTPEFLSQPSAENYLVADPYLKWDVAQDAVNHGAAVVMTSVAVADAIGVPKEKRVFLHGYGQAKDRLTCERQDLSRSRAMEAALSIALDSAGTKATDLAHIDLYSCFPCAVLIAAEAIGLDWRALTPTVTGGLPFFGGAGNNYSMHAIASMVDRLREAPGTFGLVLANGGFLSKEAAGVYSCEPRENWQPVSSAAAQAAIDAAPAPALLSEPCEAAVKTYSVTATKGELKRGYVIAETAAGRILARTRADDVATLRQLADEDAIGRRVSVTVENGINMIAGIGGGSSQE